MDSCLLVWASKKQGNVRNFSRVEKCQFNNDKVKYDSKARQLSNGIYSQFNCRSDRIFQSSNKHETSDQSLQSAQLPANKFYNEHASDGMRNIKNIMVKEEN